MEKIASPKIDLYDFQDARGQWRSLRECSLQAKEELRIRFNKLGEYLQTIPDHFQFSNAFESDDYLQFLCLQIFQLAGIKIDWVQTQRKTWDIPLISRFLFSGFDEKGFPLPSIITQINFPSQQSDNSDHGKSATYEEIIAALWSLTDNLTESLELAQTHPSGELIKILEAKVKSMEKAAMRTNSELAKGHYQKQCQKNSRARAEARQKKFGSPH